VPVPRRPGERILPIASPCVSGGEGIILEKEIVVLLNVMHSRKIHDIYGVLMLEGRSRKHQILGIKERNGGGGVVPNEIMGILPPSGCPLQFHELNLALVLFFAFKTSLYEYKFTCICVIHVGTKCIL
jgi:hypothetical protein